MTPGAAGTASYHYRGEAVGQDETDVAARLAEAFCEATTGPWEQQLPGVRAYLTDIATAALLPVVRALGDLRAAEELEAAGDAHPCTRGRLHERAAALRGEAGR